MLPGRVYRSVGITVFLAVMGVALGACGESQPTSTTVPEPEPAPTFTPVPTATPTPTQTPTPTATPTATPMPTPTSTSTPSPTPVPTPTSTPTPVPQAQKASDREGLWAGEVEDTGQAGPLPPWIALRLIPGEDPDVNLWQLLGGPFGLLRASLCIPERLETGWELRTCVRFDGTLFVPEQSDSGLKVNLTFRETTLNATLTLVPQRDESQASDNVTLLWHQPGEGIHSDIWAEDGLVFAPRYDAGIIEILDAKSGKILGTAVVPVADERSHAIVFDVKARGGLLYAATVTDGLVVFDVSEPATPQLIGQYQVFVEERSPENFTNIHNIFLSPDGKFVYAINTSFPKTDLRVIDVSDPASPKEAGRYARGAGVSFAEGVHDINVIERDGRLIAFLGYLSAGLWVLDVTDPASITELGSIRWDGIFSHSGWAFPLGDRLYYAHTEEGYDRHLTILDVTDPSNPQVVSRFRTRPGLSIHNVEVVDGIAYISYYVDGLRVVDLRDPENPREIGHFDTVPAEEERDITQGAWGVRVHEGVVYISDIETGTYAFRVHPE